MSSVPAGRPRFPRFRRSDFDVTDTVQVSSTAAVTRAVADLFAAQWPGQPFAPLETALTTFDALFTGRLAGYNGVDTVYHDRQHTLDVVLAMARLLVGYERTVSPEQRLGFDRAAMGLVTAVFHDAGYIRETGDAHRNGAEYTSSHVSRSARFLMRFMPTIGMAAWVPVATRIVHFSGYEVAFADIHLDDWRDRKAGHLLGTADLIAQMADRCYLEKCRDRLYPEFVLAGVATGYDAGGEVRVRYGSGLDLLRHTPDFVARTKRDRLDGEFGSAYRYIEPLFEGQNPYIQAIEQHLTFLNRVLKTENWPLLRRNPPCFTYDPNPLPNVRQLMLGHLRELWGRS
ncbi:MAG TPA: hypothetical protein VN787_01070 [Steroidobacteraceae bacterium]|nr:hypothetical protein [Steroidobacteraceae bacterium]